MSYPLLSQIDSPADLRALKRGRLVQVASELREYILDIVAVKAGHLGASLGVVELTVALHYIFNTPEDKLIWDVGHQAYGHKILTGRRDSFDTNRQLGGISGFPKRTESPYDAFGTGHSSTGISAALGMALAAKLQGKKHEHIAVVGDASIASGMAFEAMNHAGTSSANLLIVLNDNAIGIDPSVGALKDYLTGAGDSADGQDNIFEALGITYSGPIDGHDMDAVVGALLRFRESEGPRLLHVRTTKGKGLSEAERDQVRYHAPGVFDRKTGLIPEQKETGLPPKFQDVFGHTLVELAKKNQNITGITPAMPTGSSIKYMMQAYPDRGWDVGIAEQHAVTLAAGMAAEGLVPFCAIYSTFLQRAYDQVIHDVALQNLPVIFCIDRAGLVGEDGPTHHGAYDLAYLNCVPNIIISAPMDATGLRDLMYTAQLQKLPSPMAIRYPRGRCDTAEWKTSMQEIEIGRGRYMTRGDKVAVISIGSIGTRVAAVIGEMEKPVTHFDAIFLKPLDIDLVDEILISHDHVVTIEDGTLIGGLATTVSDRWHELRRNGQEQLAMLHAMGIPDKFIEHGSVDELHRMVRLDEESIREKLSELICQQIVY